MNGSNPPGRLNNSAQFLTFFINTSARTATRRAPPNTEKTKAIGTTSGTGPEPSYSVIPKIDGPNSTSPPREPCRTATSRARLHLSPTT